MRAIANDYFTTRVTKSTKDEKAKDLRKGFYQETHESREERSEGDSPSRPYDES